MSRDFIGLAASGGNSAVECQLPKLDVAGSIPVPRSNLVNNLRGSPDRSMTIARVFASPADAASQFLKRGRGFYPDPNRHKIYQEKLQVGADVIRNGDPLEPPVIPAKAGIQSDDSTFPKLAEWIPAFAGMTSVP